MLNNFSDKLKGLITNDLSNTKLDNINTKHISANLSAQCMPQAAIEIFSEWLDQADFAQKRADLFKGEQLNKSEDRCALHTALRASDTEELIIAGENITQQINSCLNKMSGLIQEITRGDYKPAGKAITDIVHIGVGGSALGPELCYSALRDYHINPIRVHFITVIDAEVLNNLLAQLNPASTLFFLASKSFSTEEMLCQARIAKTWLEANNLQIAGHFLAATAEIAKAEEFGLRQENILPFWNWVGGRFSVWSAVSFCVALAIGMDSFREFLNGAQAIDMHFKSQPLHSNLPVMLACLSAWHTDTNNRQAQAIIPYSEKMQLLPAFLQQLQMESLGKSITNDNKVNSHLASPIIFGDIGTRSQHSLSQYFMQAPTLVPLDIIYLDQDKDVANKRLKAHAVAQAKVLAEGFVDNDHPYKTIQAHHWHTLIKIDELTPAALGELLAIYEHKVFTLGVMYNINMFDQWGVERGKIVAKEILEHEVDNG